MIVALLGFATYGELCCFFSILGAGLRRSKMSAKRSARKSLKYFVFLKYSQFYTRNFTEALCATLNTAESLLE